MKKCLNCGQEFPNEATICPSCQTPQTASPAPPPLPMVKPKLFAAAALALLLSVVGLIFYGVPALIGFVLAIVAVVKISRSQGQLRGKGYAVAAIVIGIIAIIVWGLFGVTYALTGLPGDLRKREAKDNLKAIQAAEMAYHERTGTYADTFKALNWSLPPNETDGAYFLPGEEMKPERAGSVRLPSQFKIEVTKDTFQAAAVTPFGMFGDYLNVLIINEKGEITEGRSGY